MATMKMPMAVGTGTGGTQGASGVTSAADWVIIGTAGGSYSSYCEINCGFTPKQIMWWSANSYTVMGYYNEDISSSQYKHSLKGNVPSNKNIGTADMVLGLDSITPNTGFTIKGDNGQYTPSEVFYWVAVG